MHLYLNLYLVVSIVVATSHYYHYLDVVNSVLSVVLPVTTIIITMTTASP